MRRGERVARAYIGAILLGQAVVNGLAGGSSPTGTTFQVVAAALLLLPLVSRRPSMALRALCTLPAVVSSVYWAVQTEPFGTIGWAAWAVLTAWLCLPATPTLTLAERFHPRPRTVEA